METTTVKMDIKEKLDPKRPTKVVREPPKQDTSSTNPSSKSKVVTQGSNPNDVSTSFYRSPTVVVR